MNRNRRRHSHHVGVVSTSLLALAFVKSSANAQSPESVILQASITSQLQAEQIVPLGVGEQTLTNLRNQEAEATAPLSILDVLVMTLSNNPEQKSAQAALRAAQARIGIARADGRIQVGLGGSLGYDNYYGGGGTKTEGFLLDMQGRRSSLDLSVDVLIYDGGRSKNNRRVAEANTRSLTAQTLQVQQQLIQSTLTAYLDVLRSNQLLEVADNNLAVARERKRVSEEHLRVGKGAQLDVLRANTDLAAARQSRIEAANSLALAKTTLNILMGRAPETPLRLMPVDALMPYEPLTGKSGINNDTSAQLRIISTDTNPALMANRAAVEAALANIKVAQAQRKPSLGFSLSNLLSSPVQAAGQFLLSLGLSASQTLFDSGRARSQIAEARALAEQARYNLDEQSLRVAGEIDSALLSFDSAQKRLVNAAEAINEAQRALVVAQAGYVAGARTNLEVSDAQRALLVAQTNAANARFDVANSQVQISAAIGVLTAEGQAALKLALDAQDRLTKASN